MSQEAAVATEEVAISPSAEAAPAVETPAVETPVAKRDPLDIRDPGVEELKYPQRDGAGTKDEPEEVEPEKPETDKIDDGVGEFLKTFGVDPDKLTSRADFARELHRILAPARQSQEAPAERQQVPAPTQRQEAPRSSDGQFKFELPAKLRDKAVYDEEVQQLADVLERAHQHYEGKYSQLEQLVGSMVQHQRQQEADNYIQEFESLIDGDETLHEALGKGQGSKIGQAQLDKRRALLQAMADHETIYINRGVQPPSLKQTFNFAKSLLFESNIKQAARKEISQQLKDSKGRFTSRVAPSPKRDAPHGEGKAEASIREYLRENPHVFSQDMAHVGL